MGPVAYFGLCLLGCLLFNPTAEGVRNRTLVRLRSPCPPGTLYHMKTCYEYLDDPIKWQEAEDFCQHWRGGHLASIDFKAEENAIAKYISKTSCPSHVWIGLKATVESSKLVWGWSDGSYYPPGSALWDGKKPSRPTSSNQCISLVNVKRPQDSARWQQVACTDNHPYLCKFPSAY